MRFGIDLTACWRPRAGMVTSSIELTRALLAQLRRDEEAVIFASRERPPGLEPARATFLLSPYRHEVLNKLRWLPQVEAQAELDAVLYPYWPSPPRRRPAAPPAAVFVHDLAFRVRPREVPWQQRAYLGYLFPRSLRRAAAVLAPTQTTRADLLRFYRLNPERVHLVPEAPADLGIEEPLPEGVEPGRYLLAVGTVEPRKNYPRLLAAYRRLRDRLGQKAPDLVIVGRYPPWAPAKTRRLVESTPGVRMAGHVSDGQLLSLYRHALALAFPSLYEGFGLPLVEAMGQGTPAVVGRRGALPEVAGEAALSVDAEDVEAIASALQRLVEEAALRDDLGRRGRRRAAEFTWERSAAAALDVLRHIARDQPSTRIG